MGQDGSGRMDGIYPSWHRDRARNLTQGSWIKKQFKPKRPWITYLAALVLDDQTLLGRDIEPAIM